MKEKIWMMQPSVGRPMMMTALVVLAWYGSNTVLLLLNKYLLNTTFRQPILMSLLHMVMCAVMVYLSSFVMAPIAQIKSMKQLGKLTMLAAIFSCGVVLSNLALKYIPISFHQAIGSTTPFFTAILAVSLQGHRERGTTYLALVPVVCGVVIATGFEPSLNVWGFTAAVLATAGRAIKSVVQSMLLIDAKEQLDAMSLLFYMSTFSVMVLLPMAAVLEPDGFRLAYQTAQTVPNFTWWLVGNSMLAFCVNLTNFLVTKYTSALTLQVLGNCKGVFAAVVSVALYKNPVTLEGWSGYAITIIGTILYSESKRRNKQLVAAKDPHTNQDVHRKRSDVHTASEPLLRDVRVDTYAIV